MYHPLFSSTKFKGIFSIDSIPLSKDYEVELNFSNGDYLKSPLIYSGLKSNNTGHSLWHYALGHIYIDKNFEHIIIHCFKNDKSNEKDNRVICAPSETINEGMDLMIQMNLLEHLKLYFKD